MDITALVLFYGDYPAYAKRCLDSVEAALVLPGSMFREFRFGLNEVSENTRVVLSDFAERCADKYKLPVWFFEPAENVGKYPLMRRMLYESNCPWRTTHLMWFDDDAFLAPSFSWEALQDAMRRGDVVGQLYRWLLQKGQLEWAMRQSWFVSREKLFQAQAAPSSWRGRSVIFPQGSWWVAPYVFLSANDWPPPEMRHNGGDSMFGILCTQLNRVMVNFSHVVVNANLAGEPSKAPRRGLNELPFGAAGCGNGLAYQHVPVRVTCRQP